MRSFSRTPIISILIAFLALDLSLLYPLDVCYLTGQDPDFGDIIQAFLDTDVCMADFALAPIDPNDAILSSEIRPWPDFPDMEKVLPGDTYAWSAPIEEPATLALPRSPFEIKRDI